MSKKSTTTNTAKAFFDSLPNGEGQGGASFVPFLAQHAGTLSYIGNFLDDQPDTITTGKKTKGAKITAQCKGDEFSTGEVARKGAEMFMSPLFTTVLGCDPNIGTPGLNPVSWGKDNRTPARIYKFFKSLPYTAAGQEYLANAVTGLGVEFRYRNAFMVNGTLREIDVPYQFAGEWLKARIREISNNRNLDPSTPRPIDPSNPRNIDPSANRSIDPSTHRNLDPSNNATVLNGSAVELKSYRTKPQPTPDPYASITLDSLLSDTSELDTLLQEYRTWARVTDEILTFIRDNNLSKIDNDLAQDDLALDYYFRTVGLEVGTNQQRADKNWRPRIVSVGSFPAVITRVEQRNPDNNYAIDYVYVNEDWRYDRGQVRRVSQPSLADPANGTIAIPTLTQEHLYQSLLTKHRAANSLSFGEGRGGASWFCIPFKHLSTEQEYYSVPSSWSIFPSLTYQYASTLFYDKAVARQNGTMWGKIIYVMDEYLEKLYSSTENGNDPKVQKQLRDKLKQKINAFLRNRETNGTTTMLPSILGQDGKTVIDAIRIVDVPEPSQQMTENEIESIASCVNAALGLDSRLVGSVPGAQTSSSGTQARELELLEMKKLSTRREQYKRFYEFIIHWNNWDPRHCYPTVKDMVLSTLDASKTGVVETQN